LYAFELALAAQIRLKLSEDAEHIEEGFAGRRTENASDGLDSIWVNPKRTQVHEPFSSGHRRRSCGASFSVT
jgi:hypothetical protein